MKIGASFLGSKNIPLVLEQLNVTDVDYIHVDVMDGKYVKKKTMSLGDIACITNFTRKRLDIHLMVNKPLKYLKTIVNLNVEYVDIHLNIKENIDKVIEKYKQYGIKIGIALNPDQELEEVYPYLDKIDLILIMSVYPGLPGQEFIPETILKVKELKDYLKKEKKNIYINVDGGINFLNVKDLKDADIIVSGSTILKSDNYQDAITKLRKCGNICQK